MFTDYGPEHPPPDQCQVKNVFFSIMADECTDIANKEQFAVCLRWVDESLTTHKDDIGVYNIGTIDANTLTLTAAIAMCYCT